VLILKLIKTIFEDAYLLEPKIFGDHRGFFMESYNTKHFEELGFSFSFIQDNHSLSVDAGTLRGLHYQLDPYAQTKLVRAVRGALYDVILDIRQGSPTYGQWQGFVLTEENKRQLLVPKGFAHGFCTLVKNTEVIYKVDNYYSAEHDRGIQWNDPKLNIDWPIAEPILSSKDSQHPTFKDAENYFVYSH
jgi:dTDP-4-dehydrorhamnose 3,5-epimerase